MPGAFILNTKMINTGISTGTVFEEPLFTDG